MNAPRINEVRDFTIKRLGSKIEGTTIKKCPKCGRNAKYEPHHWPKHPERDYDQYTHKAKITNLCNLILVDQILEHCTVKAGA